MKYERIFNFVSEYFYLGNPKSLYFQVAGQIYNHKTMDDIAAIHKFVVDGDDAGKIYDIFRQSYYFENNCSPQPFKGYNVSVDFSFEDGVLRVEEKTTGDISYIAEMIYFFADRDNIFSLTEYYCDGVVQSYDVCDSEGKYFVRPPKTDWELQMEEKWNNRSVDDLPF